MALEYNRQYIGARYVPQFFKNPNGSWDWAQGFQYEPLTIVRYGENTFTSRQLVPSSVGTPNDNPDYWAQTGSYNGAILELQQQINSTNQSLQTAIDKSIGLGNLRALFITDSYGSDRTGSIGWSTRVANTIKQYGGQAWIIVNGGGGFTRYGQMNKTFAEIVASTNYNPNLIIVQGTVNDCIHSTTDEIVEGITNFYNSANSKYPNVPIILFNFSKSYRTAEENLNCRKARIAIQGVCRNLGIIYPAIAPLLLVDPRVQMSDNVHPVQGGDILLADSALQFLLGNPIEIYRILSYNNYYVLQENSRIRIKQNNIANPTDGVLITPTNAPWLGGVQYPMIFPGILYADSKDFMCRLNYSQDGLSVINNSGIETGYAIVSPNIEIDGMFNFG